MNNRSNRPEISVIVPTYNGAMYLQETLDALLVQTFPNFELLVIDDGSTDNSASVVESIEDPRVRLIRKKNKGLAHALNRGIAELLQI